MWSYVPYQLLSETYQFSEEIICSNITEFEVKSIIQDWIIIIIVYFVYDFWEADICNRQWWSFGWINVDPNLGPSTLSPNYFFPKLILSANQFSRLLLRSYFSFCNCWLTTMIHNYLPDSGGIITSKKRLSEWTKLWRDFWVSNVVNSL